MLSWFSKESRLDREENKWKKRYDSASKKEDYYAEKDEVLFAHYHHERRRADKNLASVQGKREGWL